VEEESIFIYSCSALYNAIFIGRLGVLLYNYGKDIYIISYLIGKLVDIFLLIESC
jgi:hypothetical protein